MKNTDAMFSICSSLMGLMFAYSASVQLNDPDWYFWFPLYAIACVVNLIHVVFSITTNIQKSAKFALGLGLFLFAKVVSEDFVSVHAGLWSIDLSERLVREKIGSGLVVISMFLHLKASSPQQQESYKMKNEVSTFVQLGAAGLACISYGLPLFFFLIQNGEIKLSPDIATHDDSAQNSHKCILPSTVASQCFGSADEIVFKLKIDFIA